MAACKPAGDGSFRLRGGYSRLILMGSMAKGDCLFVDDFELKKFKK